MKTKALLSSVIGLILTTLLLCLAPTTVQAQNDSDTVTLPVVTGSDVQFTALTGEEGLSSGNVYGIVQDSQGFLWFATGDGLSRYDGYSFRIFRFDRGNPNSLNSNVVVAICRGQANILWLGTTSGGVDRFGLTTETFIRYRHDPDSSNSLKFTASR